jgi:hypothetical protein
MGITVGESYPRHYSSGFLFLGSRYFFATDYHRFIGLPVQAGRLRHFLIRFLTKPVQV